MEVLNATDSDSFSFNGYKPALVATGDVTLNGGAVQNLYTKSSDPDFLGSTILTSGDATFNGGAHTTFANGQSTSSDLTKGNKGDVKAGETPLNLFSNIFSVPDVNTIIQNNVTTTLSPATFKTTTFNQNDIAVVNNSVSFKKDVVTPGSPKMIIIQGDFSIGGTDNSITIGSATAPTILLITGDFISAGSKNNMFTLYGLLYVQGTLNFGGGSDGMSIHGFTAVVGKWSKKGGSKTSRQCNHVNRSHYHN